MDNDLKSMCPVRPSKDEAQRKVQQGLIRLSKAHAVESRQRQAKTRNDKQNMQRHSETHEDRSSSLRSLKVFKLINRCVNEISW